MEMTMDIIQEAKEFISRNTVTLKINGATVAGQGEAVDIISRLVDRLESVHDVCNFNEYQPIIVTGLLDQNSFDRGYKAAMYQIYKITKAPSPVEDKHNL